MVPVRRAAFDASARYVRSVNRCIAAASADKMVWLWIREPGAPTTPACVKGHTGGVTAVRFVGADSLLSASADGTVRQWNLKTGASNRGLPAGVGPLAE